MTPDPAVELVERAERLAAAAVIGPWIACAGNGKRVDGQATCTCGAVYSETGDVLVCEVPAGENTGWESLAMCRAAQTPTALFIAASRSLVPALAAACRRLLAERASLVADLERLAADPHQSYDHPEVRGRDTSYATGIADGHRCAANTARAALAAFLARQAEGGAGRVA